MSTKRRLKAGCTWRWGWIWTRAGLSAGAMSLERQLVIQALQMALTARRPPPGLLHHSDRGSQYASEDYQALLTKHQLRCSTQYTRSCMSRAGNCKVRLSDFQQV